MEPMLLPSKVPPPEPPEEPEPPLLLFTTASKASNEDASITDKSDTVKTGDNRFIWLLTWLCIAGAAVCAGIMIVIKKQED